jgi:RIO kinase 1
LNNKRRIDEFDEYEEIFNPLKNDRRARRARKPRVRREARKPQAVSDVVETATGVDGEVGFQITYKPSKYESGWLMYSLQPFYDQELITDVQALVKGGKEASVYRCEASDFTDTEFLAAKIYRPRMFRQLRNDKMYREGRTILTEFGNPVKETDHRLMRAVGKKTGFGQQVEHTSWIMYEFTTLKRLFQAGAAVPEPHASGENAILMSYLGDDRMAAPTLNEIRLEKDEAQALFQEVMRNIELMLQHNMIHGDLSAFNILYWEGKITLIDFPQVTNTLTNRNAHFILSRDVTRICEYFTRQRVDDARNPSGIINRLWQRYVKTPPGELEGDEFNLLNLPDEEDLDLDSDDSDY